MNLFQKGFDAKTNFINIHGLILVFSPFLFHSNKMKLPDPIYDMVL